MAWTVEADRAAGRAIPIDVFWQTGAPMAGVRLPDQGVPTYRGRG